MSEYVKGSLAAENGVVFLSDTPQLVERVIPCVNTTAQAVVWMVPIAYGGRITGYNQVLDPNRPTDDAVKTLKVLDNGSHNTMFIAVTDDITLDDWGEKCNTCCGSVPEFAAPTINPPISEEAPCPTIAPGTPVYAFEFAVVQNPNTLNYSIQGSFNGAYATPAPNTAGYATLSALLTFLQTTSTGWGDYGTWTQITQPDTDKVMRLESTTVKTANVIIGLVPKNFCLDLPVTAALIDRIVIGGVETTFPSVMLDRANPEAAFFAIRPYLVGELTIPTTSGHAKYNYKGLQLPATVKNGATTVATWTAGVCS